MSTTLLSDGTSTGTPYRFSSSAMRGYKKTIISDLTGQKDAIMDEITSKSQEITDKTTESASISTAINSCSHPVDDFGVVTCNHSSQWAMIAKLKNEIDLLNQEVVILKQQTEILTQAVTDITSLVDTALETLGNISNDYKRQLDNIVDNLKSWQNNLEKNLKKEYGKIKGSLNIASAVNGLSSITGENIENIRRETIDIMIDVVFEDGFGDQNYKNIDTIVQKTDAIARAYIRYILDADLEKGYLDNDLYNVKEVHEFITQINEYKIKYPNFPVILGKNRVGQGKVFLGGDQTWYTFMFDEFMEGDTCGTVAAANILASFGIKNPETARKLGFSSWGDNSGVISQKQFLDLMIDMEKYVRPIRIGDRYNPDTIPIINLSSFGVPNSVPWYLGLKDYADAKGIKISGENIDESLGYYSAENIHEHLYESNAETVHELLYESNVEAIHELLGEYNAESFDASRKGNLTAYLKTIGGGIDYYDNKGEPTNQVRVEKHWVTIVGGVKEINGTKYFPISSWGDEYLVKYDEVRKNHGITDSMTAVWGE